MKITHSKRYYTKQEAKEYSEQVSKFIVVRSYNNLGDGTDKKRMSTPIEAKEIQTIIYSVLSIVQDYPHLSDDSMGLIIDVAKRMIRHFLTIYKFSNENNKKEHVNIELSIYLPIDEFLRSKNIKLME